VKILINLQGGSIKVMNLATPFAFGRRLCWRKVYLETIEGIGLFFSMRLPVGRAIVEMYSIRN